MNPYESPTHCEEEHFRISAVAWAWMVIALWFVGVIVAHTGLWLPLWGLPELGWNLAIAGVVMQLPLFGLLSVVLSVVMYDVMKGAR